MVSEAASPSEIVTRLFRLRREGRIEEFLALFDHEFEGSALADGARFSSREDVRAYMAGQLTGERRTEASCTRLRERGDLVLVEGRVRFMTRSGLSDSPAVWVFRVRDGRVSEVRPFESVTAAETAFPGFAANGTRPIAAP